MNAELAQGLDAPGSPLPEVVPAPVVSTEGNVFTVDFGLPAPLDGSLKSPGPEPIFLQSMTAEGFRAMSGNMQEFALRRMMANGERGKVNEWRPDFRIWEPLTSRQVEMAHDMDDITTSDKAIGVSYATDSAFSRIRGRIISSQPKAPPAPELIALSLEVIRLRRAEHKGELNSDFYTHYTDLAEEFPSSLMYRAQLEAANQAEMERAAGIKPERERVAKAIHAPVQPTEIYNSYYEAGD